MTVLVALLVGTRPCDRAGSAAAALDEQAQREMLTAALCAVQPTVPPLRGWSLLSSTFSATEGAGLPAVPTHSVVCLHPDLVSVLICPMSEQTDSAVRSRCARCGQLSRRRSSMPLPCQPGCLSSINSYAPPVLRGSSCTTRR